VVGNGIEDTERARAAAFHRPEGRPPLVLYSGRLVERKGIRELLNAIPAVLEEFPETRFVLAGGPPPLSGAEVAAQWLGPEHRPFRDRIHFTGWLSPTDLAEWYRTADVLVVPSRYEPFGMVILEGMLYGLPIVAAHVGGPAEILDHDRTGLLFPPCDTSALIRSLHHLLKNPAERQRLGQAAAHEVRQRWSWKWLVRQMMETYQEVSRLQLKAS
jgi:glycosyltransferase involved in cell wall biosynthesis